ncbi:DEAD/DEAH box helicase [Adhaeribacter sp. BT258]|uniref:DEAD/DEAH box helicase n=1 Tax=Adhaeribacter terrigena TaxID=2793070 RepID=A0ABS1BX79_9BACT|nr:DEAD/DEAH box helicase [Adhaeribacter terrigena]MBK0401756.1 DEAD/DEAH box helicase [Adhaeribacter terrigena]
MTTFADLNLKPELLQRLQEMQYHTPTPIQETAIPILLEGRDVAGQAETGSGKTAAYGLPILNALQPELQQIQALVIVPTRELAVQVQKELKLYGQQIRNLKIGAFYGGHKFSEETASLAFPPQVLVCTPGRIVDHLNRQTVELKHLKQLVLDEADKLLEMGFQEELDQLMRNLPKKRQSILFSATMPDKVKGLVVRSLNKPKMLEASQKANPNQLHFSGLKVKPEEKETILVNLLNSFDHAGTVIFVNTREAVDGLVDFLQAKKIGAKPLHGGMEQPARDKTMMLFRNGTIPVLVATDVAARGLDISALTTIIHFEIPHDEEAFLHRSGRTGRAGKSGVVYTLATEKDEMKLREWPQVKIDEWLPVSKFQRMAAVSKPKTQTAAFTTLHITAGKKDKISPRDIVGALIAEAGLKMEQIGKIEVLERFSYVAVPQKQANAIVEKLGQGRIKGKKFKVSLVK